MDTLVSVIIPTYKREFSVLNRALNSVLNQTHLNLEIIIVDDFPKTPEQNTILKEINKLNDSRIKYIEHEVNKGACAARNTGIMNANGEYIAFLDDDDEWLPEKVKLQLASFDDEEVGLVYTDSYTIKEISHKSRVSVRSHPVEGWVFTKLLKKNYIGSTSFVMIKREVFNTVGLFDTSMLSAQDAEMWLRISKSYKVRHINKPLVNYYVHEGERITTNVDRKIQGIEQLNAYYEDELNQDSKLKSYRTAILVPYYLRRDGILKALRIWIKSITIYPFHAGHKNNIISIVKHFLKKQ